MKRAAGIALLAFASLLVAACACDSARATNTAPDAGSEDAGRADASEPADAGLLQFEPPSTYFGTVDADSATIPVELRLVNRTDAVREIREIAPTGDLGSFLLRDDCTGWVLAPGGDACSVFVAFTPQHPGPLQLRVTATPVAGAPATAALDGIGRFALTVRVVLGGNGAGLVEGKGISCGADCEETFLVMGPEPFSVILTATADPGSSVSGWAGCTPLDESRCEVGFAPVHEEQVTVLFSKPTPATATLAVSTERNGGQGAVTDGGPLNCGVACEAEFPDGAAVTLNATPLPGSVFSGWDGACTGTSPTCSVTVHAPTTSVVARFQPAANLVFVSSALYSPSSLLSLAGADAQCQALATAAHLTGTFVAWLSTSTVNARDRLVTSAGTPARGWVRTDGLPFADTVDALVAPVHHAKIFYPPRVDEHGNDLAQATELEVMTGTGEDGRGASVGMCSDWTSSTGLLVVGELVAGGPSWTARSIAGTCGFRYRLYCFQTDNSVPVAPPPVPAGGRIAFITSQAFSPGTSQPPDYFCTIEARNAGLAHHWRAAVSTSHHWFIESGVYDTLGPWFRLDGVRLEFSSPWGEVISAAIALEPDGQTYSAGAPVWTGRAGTRISYSDTAADTCRDWQSSASTISGYAGIPELTAPVHAVPIGSWVSARQQTCDQSARLYCLQADF